MYKINKELVLEKLKKINLTYLITGLIILCGIILRLKVYFYNQSFYGDEGSLGFNILQKSYLQLFEPLDILQVAPPFFMIVCKFILNISHQIDNFEMRDMMLRLFPCLCSIISLPLFSYLIHKMFNNRYMTWICSAMLAFNAVAINYTQVFKQYTCEIMFTIILLIVFHSLNIKTVSYKNCWLYSLLLVIAPWFSNPAWFVMAGGFLVIILDMIKNKYYEKLKLGILFIPVSINFLIWLFIYYNPVHKELYRGMFDYWNNVKPAFLSLHNFSHMFVDKMQNFIVFPYSKLLFVFLIGSIIILFANKEFKNSCKYLVLIPILLCIIASFLKHYPFERRVILFLLPIFIILYAQITLLLKNNKITTFILCLFLIFISIDKISYSAKRYTFLKTNFRNSAYILKNYAPDFSNVFITLDTPYKYYFNYNIKHNNKLFYERYNQNFEDSTFPQKLKKLPINDYWIEHNYHVNHYNFGPKLKEYLYNDPHLKVIQEWTAPYDENVYLIHFKKIKDYH